MILAPRANFAGAHRPRSQGAAVLFEVLLALILFAAAAAVATGAFNASLTSLERQKYGSQGLNLAASVLAEVQLGIRTAGTDSPQPLEPPFADWTWETSVTPAATTAGTLTGASLVEVAVKHAPSGTVKRLAQVITLPAGATNATPASPTTP